MVAKYIVFSNIVSVVSASTLRIYIYPGTPLNIKKIHSSFSYFIPAYNS